MSNVQANRQCPHLQAFHAGLISCFCLAVLPTDIFKASVLNRLLFDSRDCSVLVGSRNSKVRGIEGRSPMKSPLALPSRRAKAAFFCHGTVFHAERVLGQERTGRKVPIEPNRIDDVDITAPR